MLRSIRDTFTKHLALKALALILALMVWFYIVNELNKGSSEETQLLRKMRFGEGMVAKKLMIRPVFVGRPYPGYAIVRDQVVVAPEYCIVIGAREVLGKVKSAYTVPIDINKASKTFSVSAALSPISPGVFTEETLVQVTVPIEKETDKQ